LQFIIYCQNLVSHSTSPLFHTTTIGIGKKKNACEKGIANHMPRNQKVEPVCNQGESEGGSMEGWKKENPHRPTASQPMGVTHEERELSEPPNSLTD